jgi:hypothetical protein
LKAQLLARDRSTRLEVAQLVRVLEREPLVQVLAQAQQQLVQELQQALL